MSPLKDLLVLTCLALFVVSHVQSEPQNPDKPLRFSRLLNQRPDLLLHTSISNAPTNTPRKEFIKGQIKKKPIVEITHPDTEEASSDIHRAYLHGEAVRRVPQDFQEERNDEETLTTINQKPISGRIPVSVLRQSSGNNRLNISPVFSEPERAGTRRRPLVENVTERQRGQQRFENDVEQEITTNPNVDEYGDEITGTTERIYESEEEIPPAPLGPSPPVIPSAPERERAQFVVPDQIIPLNSNAKPVEVNDWRTFVPLRVVSDNDKPFAEQGRSVEDNLPTVPPTFATTTTTTTTPSPIVLTTIQSDILPAEFSEKENLLADSFHRKGQFPDFEDSPSHLATAESNTPARVNVRPASSGKDYEYEYIYYYYDDDDDDNSTSTTTKLPSDASSSSVAPTEAPKIEPESSRVVDSFAPEKIQTSKLSSQANALERSRESKTLPESDYEIPPAAPASRGPPRGTPVTTTTTEDNRYVPQEPTTEIPEPVKIQKPVGNRPVLLKQSGLIPTTTVAAPTTTTTTTTEPSTTSEVPASRQVGSRFRPSKDRFDSSKSSNKFAAPVQSITDAPSVSSTQSDEPAPRRTPNYKETSRRTPTRRPLSQQPQVEEPVTEKLQSPKSKAQLIVPEDQPRPSSRTRFPPRIQPTSSSASSEVGNSLADSAPSNAIVEVTSPQLSTLQPNSIESDDRKAKDNFARTKSINDLYALTRLHQLAINTRIPNRKTESGPVYKGTPPKFAGGFISSSEGTTQVPDEHLLSEATTITAFIPPSHVSSSTTEQSSTSNSNAPTEEHFGGKRNRGFRGRQRPTQGTSSTTEAPARPSSSSRFGGRRRTFTPASETPVAASVASTQEGAPPAEEQPAQVPSSQAPVLRAPGRHRFSGRTRPSSTSTTTENPENVPPQVQGQSPVEQPTPSSPPKRVRPGGFGQNRRKPTTSAAPQVVEGAEAPAPSETAPPAESEPKRRPGGGKVPRNRPGAGAGGTGPIIGRPLRLRKTTTTTTEAAEPAQAVAQENAEVVAEQIPTAISEQVDVVGPPAPAVSQKVTIASSTTVVESPVEPTQLPKRGSAAALGRLRPRPGKPAALPTTAAPEVTTAARKPSRLNGILNRKKLAQTPTTAPTTHVEEHEETHDNGQEQVEALPKGTIVQVSTIVSESEETPDHNGEIVDDHASTTAASILNRLKSQRKPGSLFRKRVE